MQTIRNYIQAPLPFIGQKRNSLRFYLQTLQKILPKDGEGWTIVDAFGGSGLLSHHAKRNYPQARVLYNDFDDYQKRVAHIPQTNRLRRQIAALLPNLPKNARIPDPIRDQILRLLETQAHQAHYQDYLCLSSWLLFTGNIARNLEELQRRTLYNCLRETDYPEAPDYLAGVETIRSCYADLLTQHRNNPKALFILDPPYLFTLQDAYQNPRHFGLVDFLYLIRLTRPPFLFFSSSKIEFSEYLQYLQQTKSENWQNFQQLQETSYITTFNHSARRQKETLYWKA